MKSLSDTQKAFCNRLAEGSRFIELFDYLPDIYFYCKDRDGLFIFANEAEAKAFGVGGIEDILGKTDYDFFPPELADRYRDEDRVVMDSGISIDNKAWLVPDQKGQLNWYLSSKLPLYDTTGDVIGIAGVMRDLSAAGAIFDSYRELAGVLKFVQAKFSDPIEVQDLATEAGMSVSTLERRFRALFQQSPMQYVIQVRVQAATQESWSTQQRASEILRSNAGSTIKVISIDTSRQFMELHLSNIAKTNFTQPISTSADRTQFAQPPSPSSHRKEVEPFDSVALHCCP